MKVLTYWLAVKLLRSRVIFLFNVNPGKIFETRLQSRVLELKKVEKNSPRKAKRIRKWRKELLYRPIQACWFLDVKRTSKLIISKEDLEQHFEYQARISLETPEVHFQTSQRPKTRTSIQTEQDQRRQTSQRQYLTSPSRLSKIREALQKSTGPNWLPYKTCKNCPQVASGHLWNLCKYWSINEVNYMEFSCFSGPPGGLGQVWRRPSRWRRQVTSFGYREVIWAGAPHFNEGWQVDVPTKAFVPPPLEEVSVQGGKRSVSWLPWIWPLVHRRSCVHDMFKKFITLSVLYIKYYYITMIFFFLYPIRRFGSRISDTDAAYQIVVTPSIKYWICLWFVALQFIFPSTCWGGFSSFFSSFLVVHCVISRGEVMEGHTPLIHFSTHALFTPDLWAGCGVRERERV